MDREALAASTSVHCAHHSPLAQHACHTLCLHKHYLPEERGNEGGRKEGKVLLQNVRLCVQLSQTAVWGHHSMSHLDHLTVFSIPHHEAVDPVNSTVDTSGLLHQPCTCAKRMPSKGMCA